MRSVSSALAVSRITGVPLVARRKPVSERPSSPGIMTSTKAMSIAWAATISRAAAAFDAFDTRNPLRPM